MYGGDLVLGTTSEPKSFNPVVAKETSTTTITSLIFEGLTRTNPVTLEVEPNLAFKWQVDESGRVWTFFLRRDVFFNDGEKFTADDVVFTFQDLIYNPQIPNSARDIFTIEGKKIKVKKIDDYTVEFILPYRFAPFLRALSQEILPEHKYKKLVQENKFTFSLGLDSKPQDIVGTGPFMIDEYLPGERIVLKRNPFYWKKDAVNKQLPYLDRIIYLILPSPDTLLLKFLEGEIDYYPLRAEDLAFLAPLQEKKNFTIYNAGPSFGSNFLAFNQNPGKNPRTNKFFVQPYKLNWFKSKLFRQAISYAINREEIIKIVFNGLGVPQYGPLSPSAGFFYHPGLKKYSYNPEKSLELLSSLGFKDLDQDGFLEDRDGHKLQINLFTNADNPQRILIASMIRKDLEDVGIKINFQALEFNNLVTKLTSTFDWEAIIIGLTGGVEPHFGKNVWSSKGVLHLWYPSQKSPQTEWERRIDEIFDSGSKTLDPEQRKRLYAEWQEIVNEELPLIYTVLPYSLYAVRNKFGNLYPTVYGGAFSELEYLYLIKKKNQLNCGCEEE